MEIAVIGGGGFIGRKVAEKLIARRDVERLTLVDKADFSPPADARVCKKVGDFADPHFRQATIDGADRVLILAAVLGGAAEADYAFARKINVDATLDLIEDLRDISKPPRIVYASAAAVYGAPLPDRINDNVRPRPTMVYGAQKLMMETVIEHFSRRGWIDGLALRLPGIVARPGADARLKSAFLNNLFYAARDGVEITLPVSPDATTWLQSVTQAADNLVHGLILPKASLGDRRAMNLPSLTVRIADLVETLKSTYPQTSTVHYRPDAEIEAQFGSFPPLEAPLAESLGFRADASLNALVTGSLR